MNSKKSEPMSAAAAIIPPPVTRERVAHLFAEHYRRVLIAAYRITGSIADAEDVAQSVFLRLGTGQSAPLQNAGSYLYRAAINGALDLLRRQKAAALEPLEAAAHMVSDSSAASPEAEVSSAQLAVLLRQAIGELSPRAAEIFTLRYIEDLDNREIATITGASQVTVAVTLYQSRAKLRKRLAELEWGKL